MGALPGFRYVQWMSSALKSLRSLPEYSRSVHIEPHWNNLQSRSTPGLSIPLPTIIAESSGRTWCLRTLTSSTFQHPGNAIKLPADFSQKVIHSNTPQLGHKSNWTPSFVQGSYAPTLSGANQLITPAKPSFSVQGAALKVRELFSTALPPLHRSFSLSPGLRAPLAAPSGSHAFVTPSSAPALSFPARLAAAGRAFSSDSSPGNQHNWLQRLTRQARSAVAQPRTVAAGVSERGAAAFDSLTGAGARYRQALALQVAGFWNRNSLLLYGAIGLAVILLLWRLMFGIASMFLNFSEWMADLGFLALASSMVLLGGLYLRRRMTINPDSVYRQVMRQVNTFPSVLEVLGAPLTGSDVRAYVMSGGGIRMKGLTPKFSTKRAYLIFPIRGSERRGLVSVEAKKRHGKYEFKLISVDVPTASGAAEQRLYLVGDHMAYQKAGQLINELRDPIIQAMAMEHQFEEEDDKEDEEEARAQREAEARKFQEQLAKEAAQLQAEAEAREREEEAAKAVPKTP